MTPDPSADTPAAELTKALRPLLAFVLLGVNAVWLLIDAQGYLLPSGTSSFTDRSPSAFLGFTSLVTSVGLPLLAVLLATHVAPVLAQARLIVLAALGEFAFAGLFAALSFLLSLFSGGDFRTGFEGFFIRLGYLAIFGVAALVVFRVAQPMLANGPPKEDRLSQYGRGGFDPYAGQEQPPQQYGANTYGAGTYGSPQQQSGAPYGQQPFAEPAPYNEPAAYNEPPVTYGSSTYGEAPTTYGEQPQYTQQFPPQQYGGDPNAGYSTGGSYSAPPSQTYGGAAQQPSAPPAWEPQPPTAFPPQPPGGWPASQLPTEQPPASNVYGGAPSWPEQPPSYQDDHQATQMMSPEARERAEAARRAAQNPPEQTWYDQR